MNLLMPALLVALFLRAASSEPVVAFPFNSQLPPAARINKFYTYTLPPSTFASSSKRLTYSLGRHPEWLSMESSQRRLYGTPRDSDLPPGDVVGQEFEIIATDDHGSTTNKATLVVARSAPPTVRIPMTDQIESFGKLSAPSSVLSYPSTDFKFMFDPKTFGEQGYNYYATSGDGSPLPAWVSFNAPTLAFAGRTPPFKSLFQPPQAFDFRLVASDIVGFAASSLSFSIVVGSHKLTTNHPIISLNASWGSELEYGGLENAVQLDGQFIAPGDLSVTVSSLPHWLTLDPKTLKLKGTPGSGDHSTNFTISFDDPFSDTLNVLVVLHVASGLFESALDDMEARPGSLFELDLAKYFQNAQQVSVDVTTSPLQDWLKTDGLKIAGQVPKTAKGDFMMSIQAKSTKSSLQEREIFAVRFQAVDGSTASPTTSTTSPTSSRTQMPTGSDTIATDSIDSEPGHLSTGEILLATIIPIIFITILLILLICYLRRRCARRTYLSNKFRTKISHPMATSLTSDDSESSICDPPRPSPVSPTGLDSYKTAPAGFINATALPLRGRSSETLRGLPNPQASQPLTDEAGTVTSGSIGSFEDGDDRQSWVTVNGDEGALERRSDDFGRPHSDATYPESTHQILPTPELLSSARHTTFRPGRDMTMPTIVDIPRINVYNRPGHYRRRSFGLQSTSTSSSSALPSMLGGTYRAQARKDGSTSNWETIVESEAGENCIAEPRRPDKALVSSKPEGSRHWYDTESSVGSKQFGTETSFASSENWRVIAPRAGPGGPHRNMVEEAALCPEPLSPSRWVRDVQARTATQVGPSTTIASMRGRNDGEDMMLSGGGSATWRREHSGQPPSEGSGSFKVFL